MTPDTLTRGLTHALAALTLAAAALPALAWPDRPVTMVVPYPPGGAADVLGRIVARHLQLQLPGSTVVVENKAGAGTAVAAQAVAQAAPDGHTLLISSNTTWTMNPALKSRLPYDPVKSFEALGTIGGIPLVVLVHPATPAQSVRELVALAKAQPGKLSYASFGAGSSSHFAGEMFKAATGADMVHVPYKGSAPAMQDLIGNQVPVSFDTNIATVPQLRAGKVRALAVLTPQRIASLPDVPTGIEAGVKDFVMPLWYGMFAPAGTPREIVARLHGALVAALKSPDTGKQLTAMGVDPWPGSPEELGTMLREDIARYGEIVRSAGLPKL